MVRCGTKATRPPSGENANALTPVGWSRRGGSVGRPVCGSTSTVQILGGPTAAMKPMRFPEDAQRALYAAQVFRKLNGWRPSVGTIQRIGAGRVCSAAR